MPNIIMPDNIMPEGTTYILVIDTNAYAGNFEREICGYATGIFDEERGHGEKESKIAIEAGGDMVTEIIDKSMQVSHYEYGMVSNTMRRSPKRDDDSKSFEYNSVAIFFNEPLSKKEMEFVRLRTHEYARLNGFVVYSVHMMKYVVEAVETKLPD